MEEKREVRRKRMVVGWGGGRARLYKGADAGQSVSVSWEAAREGTAQSRSLNLAGVLRC